MHARSTYVVVAPYDGIETSSVQTQLGIIADLAGPLHATLVFQQADIWLFELAAHPGATGAVRSASPTEPAWAARTVTGSRQLRRSGSQLAPGADQPGAGVRAVRHPVGTGPGFVPAHGHPGVERGMQRGGVGLDVGDAAPP